MDDINTNYIIVKFNMNIIENIIIVILFIISPLFFGFSINIITIILSILISIPYILLSNLLYTIVGHNKNILYLKAEKYKITVIGENQINPKYYISRYGDDRCYYESDEAHNNEYIKIWGSLPIFNKETLEYDYSNVFNSPLNINHKRK